jgi:hypothetical protein
MTTAPRIATSAARFAQAITGIGEKRQLEEIDRLFAALIQDGCPPWALRAFGHAFVAEYRRVQALPRSSDTVQ